MAVRVAAPLPSERLRAFGHASVVVLGVLLAYLVLPWLAMNVGIEVQQRMRWLDPDDTFVYLFVHHGVEALGAIAMIVALRRPLAEFGFRLGDWRTSLRATAWFALAVLILAFLVDALPYLISGGQPPLAYWPTQRNVLGTLAFQWLWVGFGEEILFRGLLLGLLLTVFARRLHVGRLSISVAGVIVAVLFAFEHAILYDRSFFLAITFSPNWFQLAWAFVLGIYYAALRERTGSLLGPILSHNLSDGICLSMTYAVLR